MIGGAGTDTAYFSGAFAAYTVTDLGGGMIGVAGPDGSDTLVGIERFQFDDRLLTPPFVRDLRTTLSVSGTSATTMVRNYGILLAGASTAGLYLSADATVTTADTLLASSAIGALNEGEMAWRTVTLGLPSNLTPGTYYLGAIADTAGQVAESEEGNNLSTVVALTLGNAGDNAVTGGAGNDTLIAFGGNDILSGLGAADVLVGGAGADTFMFNWAAVTDTLSGAGFDRIADYDRSAGAFNAGEGDRIDLSQILAGAYAAGQPVGSLVRVFQAGSGALLQVDTDGAANGANWVTVARLEGVRFGDTVDVRLSGSAPDVRLAVQRPSATDYSADHTSDLLWRTDSGALAIWDLNGTRIESGDFFRIGPSIINADGPDWQILGTGDFDGDGHADVLWASDGGYAAVWEMDGNQIKAQDCLRSGANPITRPDPSWHIVGSNDFDGDGKGGMLWRTASGALAIWELDGTQLKSAGYVNDGFNAIPAPGADWHVAATDDFDGDGKADILWRTNSGSLAVWEMDGTQIKVAGYVNNGTAAVGAPGADWHIAGTADFDGDGKSGDILWRTDSGSLAIWLMNGTAIKSAGYVNNGAAAVGAPGPDWHIERLGDYDGDGKNDLLWRTDLGSLAIWEMNGTAIKFAGYVNNGVEAVGAPGPDWHIVKPDYYLM